jgi:hypothetical protein
VTIEFVVEPVAADEVEAAEFGAVLVAPDEEVED